MTLLSNHMMLYFQRKRLGFKKTMIGLQLLVKNSTIHRMSTLHQQGTRESWKDHACAIYGPT